MLELDQFTVAELAAFTGVPAASIRTYIRRHALPMLEPVGREPTGRRGGAWQRYRVSDVEALRAATDPVRVEVGPPRELIAAEEILLRTLTDASDELRSYYLDQARQLRVAARPVDDDREVEAHLHVVDALLALEAVREPADWIQAATALRVAAPGIRVLHDGQLLEAVTQRFYDHPMASPEWDFKGAPEEDACFEGLRRALERWRETWAGQTARSSRLPTQVRLDGAFEILLQVAAQAGADLFIRVPARPGAQPAAAAPLVEERMAAADGRELSMIFAPPGTVSIDAEATFAHAMLTSLRNTEDMLDPAWMDLRAHARPIPVATNVKWTTSPHDLVSQVIATHVTGIQLIPHEHA